MMPLQWLVVLLCLLRCQLLRLIPTSILRVVDTIERTGRSKGDENDVGLQVRREIGCVRIVDVFGVVSAEENIKTGVSRTAKSLG
ncbi:hypothetical protein C8Q80DRAFT_169108 [Daedaleopsis nitida]|nr:hypothetical protein C8Q80DRAFT_169108 [Daedaleopsis nitida]